MLHNFEMTSALMLTFQNWSSKYQGEFYRIKRRTQSDTKQEATAALGRHLCPHWPCE